VTTSLARVYLVETPTKFDPGAESPQTLSIIEALLRVSQTLISIRSSEKLFNILARELRAVVNFYVMGVGIYAKWKYTIGADTSGYSHIGLETTRALLSSEFCPICSHSWRTVPRITNSVGRIRWLKAIRG
jgi:hypothetical protein